MPILTIKGFPSFWTEEQVTPVRDGLKKVAANAAPALKFTEKDILVYIEYERDSVPAKEQPVVVYVDMFKKPERTVPMFNMICDAVVAFLKQHLEEEVVEAYGGWLDPAIFSTSEK